jgi:glutamate-5-semialdehyde dehydrogenase
LETLLIDVKKDKSFVIQILSALKEKGLREIRGEKEIAALLPGVTLCGEEEFYKEYEDLILKARFVDGLDEAIAHINRYGTGHSDAILTQDEKEAAQFVKRVDSAAVYVNASTRFTDGFEFGLGAEMGISTQKLHARGPIGLKELTGMKYVIKGNGQIRK